jgi:hypothetical protein
MPNLSVCGGRSASILVALVTPAARPAAWRTCWKASSCHTSCRSQGDEAGDDDGNVAGVATSRLPEGTGTAATPAALLACPPPARASRDPKRHNVARHGPSAEGAAGWGGLGLTRCVALQLPLDLVELLQVERFDWLVGKSKS